MKKSFLIFSIVLGLFLFSSLNPNLISAQYIITDSYGDASTNDMLSISGGFNGTNLLLGANFRPGTFNSNNLGFAWGLDTNLDGLTDYETYFNSLRNPAQMLLQKIIRPNVWNIAYIPVSFGANSLNVSIPLSLLGGSNGTANFYLWTGVPLNSNNFLVTDAAPSLVTTLGGPTSAIVPPLTPLNMAQFSNAVMSNQIVPLGYSEVLSSGNCSAGYCAKAYWSQTNNRIVLAIGGTNDFNDWMADATFININGAPTQVFKDYVAKAVTDLKGLRNNPAYSTAEITLTGHSLGGALAQILAKATGLTATTFDAPGAAAAYNYLVSQLAPLSYVNNSWPIGLEKITNYRIYGDLVSTVGTQLGSQVTYEPPIPKWMVDTFSIGTAKPMHLLSMMMERLSNNAPISSSIGPTAANAVGSLLNTVAFPTLPGITVLGVNGVVVAGDFFFIDPQGYDAYLFSGDADSPYFRSVTFPYLYTIDAMFRLEDFENGMWTSLGLFNELSSYDFGPNGVDQFRFFVLDQYGLLPATSVEPFTVGVTFVSDGEFNGTLTSYSTVPEPATVLLLGLGLIGLAGVRRKFKQ